MVQLQGSNPVEGERWSITARDGEGPYTFIYRIDEEPSEVVEQDNPTLVLPIPKGSSGDSLSVDVTDGGGLGDKKIFEIEPP